RVVLRLPAGIETSAGRRVVRLADDARDIQVAPGAGGGRRDAVFLHVRMPASAVALDEVAIDDLEIDGREVLGALIAAPPLLDHARGFLGSAHGARAAVTVGQVAVVALLGAGLQTVAAGGLHGGEAGGSGGCRGQNHGLELAGGPTTVTGHLVAVVAAFTGFGGADGVQRIAVAARGFDAGVVRPVAAVEARVQLAIGAGSCMRCVTLLVARDLAIAADRAAGCPRRADPA